MKRGFRLRRPIDIRRVRRKGTSTAHPFLVLFVLPNEGEGVRVAVTAGRAIGGAVQRNRAKRVLRAAVLPFLAQLQPDHDFLLMARTGIRETKSTQLQEALGGLLMKAKLLKKE
ncbi:MAG: ribonuclease P protein component [Anaerolineales bacterium]